MRKTLVLGLALLLSGCSTVYYQKSEVLSRENEISLLKGRLDSARSQSVDLLAPSFFEYANAKLNEAVEMAKKSQDPKAGSDLASEGLSLLEQAEKAAKQNQEIFSSTLKNRDSAVENNAHVFFEKEFLELDGDLVKAARLAEKNELSLARNKNVELAAKFSALETRAMKANINDYAKSAYDAAIAAGADRNAPITLKKAKAELELARKIIDLEKGDMDKAKGHAENAKNLALQSKGISLLVADFKKADMTREEMVLWHQNQLSEIYQPLNEEISFAADNPQVQKNLTGRLDEMSQYIKELETRGIACEKDIAGLKSSLAQEASQTERAKLEMAQKEESFRSLSALFNKDEAVVLMRDDDIIIRSYGFNFAVGKADIAPSNFSLLNKIVTAILRFPKASIVVEGHTDNSGSNRINLRLSEERANNIAKFLVEVAKIDSSMVSSIGLGDSRPLASNETAEGRAQNRRIEVIIEKAK